MLDEELVGEILSDDSEETIELYRDFIEDVRERLKQAESMSLVKSLEETKRHIHQLRGVNLNFGFSGVAQTLDIIEFKPETLDDESYEATIIQAESIFDQSLARIKKLYPNLA